MSDEGNLTSTPQSPATASARAPWPKWLLPTITGVGGLLLGVALVGGVVGVNAAITAAKHDAQVAKVVKAEKAQKRILFNALAGCGLSDDDDTQIGDGGYTLTVNNQGEDDFSGISYDDLQCLEEALKTPASVASHIGQTTSLDGRQTESWGNITMSWTYHPDRGLDAVYTVKR